MRYLKLTFAILLFFVCRASQAQQNFQQDYLNAKLLFKEGKYSLAMEAFKPLIPKNEGNYFSEYASFYYAISAYNQNYPAMAKDMFLQLKQFYPKWSRIDEVNFWLGKIYLESDEFDRGIKVLNGIRKGDFREDIKNLKYFSFSTISDLELLKGTYESYPEEEELGQALANAIAQSNMNSENREILEKLIDKFDLDPKKYNMEDIKPVFKDKYKVAVMFPFMAKDMSINKGRKRNQFVLNIYHGIRLACDSLKNTGHNIELYAYDTRRDTAETRRILEKEELKGMDVIIGPLSKGSVQMVSDFSLNNRINMINPFSTRSSVTQGNPFSFLFHPSDETIAAETAKYVLDRVSDKPAAIFYGESKTDSIRAYAYEEIMKQAGHEVSFIKKIKRDNTEKILDILLVENTRSRDAADISARDGFSIKQDSLSHIYVASDNHSISSKVLSAAVTRGDSLMVIGSANWLKSYSTNYDTYYKLGIVLHAPSYVSKDSRAYRTFWKKYVKMHRKSPDQYAESGYELMMILGQSLNTHGKYFQVGWNKEEFSEGCLGRGYRYKFMNNNGVVPMLNFSKNRIRVDSPTEFEPDGDTEE